jgi:hypothetical protein
VDVNSARALVFLIVDYAKKKDTSYLSRNKGVIVLGRAFLAAVNAAPLAEQT